MDEKDSELLAKGGLIYTEEHRSTGVQEQVQEQ